MRILYIDIDSLRPDHLGCYGYLRPTSPNIDRVAAQGVRFASCHASDVPCLPSRTSLFSGRFGIHSGVIGHGGVTAEPFIEGAQRGFQSTLGRTSWMACLRQAGLHTATISPFGERHSAWWWYANFNEIHNTGRCGGESAEEVSPLALDWIRRRGKSDNWFLHVNLWDPHTPYRAPAELGEPFADLPCPPWLTERVRQLHWAGCGPHSAQEVRGYDAGAANPRFPRQPVSMSDMNEVRRMFDGYDAGVLWADQHIGRILNALADEGVLDETVLIISSDHGENLGELNIYGDHQTADLITTRVPLIIRWPGLTDGQAGRLDSALHYANDMAATTLELLGRETPPQWDGVSFAETLRTGQAAGRDYLVLSQGAWSCQRSVRFRTESRSACGDFLCIRSYHDGHHGFPDVMLFDVNRDPHEQTNLALEHPDLVAQAMDLLDDWYGQMMRSAGQGSDPMWTVLQEGGPFHTRGNLPNYLERLRATNREKLAKRLAAKHPGECPAP